MPTLLIVHHTPSPGMQALFEKVVEGATTDEIEDVDVVRRPALAATASDVLDADGYLLGTPANLGYMSGALKHFLDTVYYPCLDSTSGRPYGCWIHGNEGTEGAARAIRSITGGLGWTPIAEPLELRGGPDQAALDAAWELGATAAASLLARAGRSVVVVDDAFATAADKGVPMTAPA